ncbi:MAG: hypothetical protein ACXADY_09905, partial [Candidatus Hodarchaeales archaeon]
MSKMIYNYALIKSLYSQSSDYIDTFWPFIVRTIGRNDSVDISLIQRNLEKEFDLKIPMYVVETILQRAEIKGFINRISKENLFALSKKGVTFSDRLETDEDVIRRSNALLEDMNQFFESKSITLGNNEIRTLLTSFIQKNINSLIEFFNPNKESDCIDSKLEKKEEQILDYIRIVETKKPEQYGILRDIIFGSVISMVLHMKEPSEIRRIEKENFEKCQVYLDTNFLFSLFELHTPDFNKPALELYNLLKKQKFYLKAFD